MRLICVGDVVSSAGVSVLERTLPRLRREYRADVVIVNGENSADGNGITERSYSAVMAAGADVVTGGNHSFQRRGAERLHDEQKRLIRPANLRGCTAGRGELILDTGRSRLRIVSLLGSLFMKDADNPFEYAERLESGVITVIDFHAEATSEKRALGFFLDGKAALVYGTHTHVQTCDAQILPQGTGYITDIGMTGVKNSVIGKTTEGCVHNFRYPEQKVRVSDASGEGILCGIFAEIDDKSGKCVAIERVCVDNAAAV